MGLFGFGKKEKDKMKDGLEKTRTGFWGNILNTLTGSKIDDDLYDELEEQLILADVGGEVAIKLVDKLRDRVNEKGLKTGEQAADELRELILSLMTDGTRSFDGNLAKLGYADLAKPSEIEIYPDNFEDKQQVIGILDAYNQRMIDSGQEDKKISYTDFVGTLMKSVTTIVDMISYVLIAFVAISLS